MAFTITKEFIRRFSYIPFGGPISSISKGVAHTPIFFQEVLNQLKPKKDQLFVDATYGDGGHSGALMSIQEHCRLFAFDKNVESIDLAKSIWEAYNPKFFKACVSRFSDLPKHFKQFGIGENEIDGFIIDCGVSDLQLNGNNGLSGKGPLDLRLDPLRLHELSTGVEILRNLSHSEIFHLLKNIGKFRHNTDFVTQIIIESQYMFNLSFTAENLYEIILDAVKFSKERKSLFLTMAEAIVWEDTATQNILLKIITALRMVVNDELYQLRMGVSIASHYLKPGGILIVIVRNEVEENELRRLFIELDSDSIIENEVEGLTTYPLRMEFDNPLPLPQFDQILHPHVHFARMYVASKIQ